MGCKFIEIGLSTQSQVPHNKGCIANKLLWQLLFSGRGVLRIATPWEVSVLGFRRVAILPLSLLAVLLGCGSNFAAQPGAITITSVVPSSTGAPNSVASLWPFEFVSVQGTGQIFSYNVSTGSQVAVGTPYATPCADPSGMVIAAVSGVNIMAVACYDTGSLLTLTVNADGSLTALGSVGGLASPYPGIALDGTNVFLPLFGVSQGANGGVAKVSIANPVNPVVTGVATLTSPGPGEYANPGYLAVNSGYIIVAAGSESGPQSSSSTVQMVSEASMTVVGAPLVVAHSPQQISIKNNIAYVTLYDAAEVEAIDVSMPGNLLPLQVLSMSSPGVVCHGLGVLANGNSLYVGCYSEGMIQQIDITNPAAMVPGMTISGVSHPQQLRQSGSYLLIPTGVTGGSVYEVNANLSNTVGGKV